MLSPEAIIGIEVTLGGALVAMLRWFVRAEFKGFWLKLQGPEGFVPRREFHLAHGELKRRVATLEHQQ
jgi:hypothetical protein